jgi:hypothetical protein
LQFNTDADTGAYQHAPIAANTDTQANANTQAADINTQAYTDTPAIWFNPLRSHPNGRVRYGR